MATPHALRRGHDRRWDRALAVAIGLLLVAWCLREDVQPDLYFHLTAGRAIAATASLPRAGDFLAVHPDHPFLDHEWAFQAMAWPLWRLGDGPLLLRLVQTLGAAVCLAGLAAAAARHGPARWVALLPVILVAGPRLTLRPEVLSFGALGLLIGVLARARFRPSRRAIAGLALVQVAWVNLHGLSLLGPLVAVACACASLVHRALAARAPAAAAVFGPPSDPRRLGLLAGALLLAQLVNPYGLAGGFYIVQHAVEAFTRESTGALPITEFIPPLDPRVRSQLPVRLAIGWAIVAAPLALAAARARRLRAEEVAIATLLVPLTLPYVRNLPLLAIGLAPLTAAGLAALADRLPPRGRAAAAAAALVAGLLLTRATLADRFHDNADHDARAGLGLGGFLAYPEAAAALDARPPGPLFNNFGMGHYLLWARDGRAPRPFVCGNLDLYPREHLDRYHALVEGRSDWRAELAALGIDAVLADHRVEAPAFLDALLADPGWRLEHADPHAVLVVRGPGPGLDRAAFARSTLGRTFADERPDGFGPTVALRAVGLLPDREPRPIDRLHLALLLDRLGRPAEALALARRARELAPLFAPVVLAAAELERRHGDPAEARRLYERAAGLVESSPGPWLGLGHLELAAGDPAAAARAYREALARAPGATDARSGLLSALEAAGDPIELRRGLASLAVRPALAAYYEGAAARLEKDLPRAEARLREALRLEPGLAPALDRLARVRLEQRDPAGAEAALTSLVASTPGSGSAWRDLGTVRYQRGALDGALEAWRRAAAADPGEVPALVFAAQVELARGRRDPAAALVEEALRRRPGHPEALALRRRLSGRDGH